MYLSLTVNYAKPIVVLQYSYKLHHCHEGNIQAQSPIASFSHHIPDF